MKKYEVESLSWEDVTECLFDDTEDEKFVMEKFSNTIWFYNTGEYDESERWFQIEKEDLLEEMTD